MFLRMFEVLKALAQRRPFVADNGGHSAQFLCFMDVDHNCNSLKPQRGCPHPRCETQT